MPLPLGTTFLLVMRSNLKCGASSNSSARNARGPEAQPLVPRELQPRMVDAAVGGTPTD